jgi:flavorubredoxin
MGLISPLPMDRVYFLNPGQSIDIGDRKLTAIKPPSFDAPETTGFIDEKSRALFSSDCFGALLSDHAEDARELPQKDLAKSQMLWATVDSPWLHSIDRTLFGKALHSIRGLAPSVILSSHLPAAPGMTDQLLRTLAAAPESEPFVGPDQEALQQMLSAITRIPQAIAA